jgi:hypothetical protein
MMTPQGLQIASPEDSLARLRIVTNGIVIINIVFRVGIARLLTRASACSGPHGFAPLARTALAAVSPSCSSTLWCRVAGPHCHSERSAFFAFRLVLRSEESWLDFNLTESHETAARPRRSPCHSEPRSLCTTLMNIRKRPVRPRFPS